MLWIVICIWIMMVLMSYHARPLMGKYVGSYTELSLSYLSSSAQLCVWIREKLQQRKDSPIVQLEVILLLLGLCRSSSSSLLVGSHVEYFSPIPGHRSFLEIKQRSVCYVIWNELYLKNETWKSPRSDVFKHLGDAFVLCDLVNM